MTANERLVAPARTSLHVSGLTLASDAFAGTCGWIQDLTVHRSASFVSGPTNQRQLVATFEERIVAHMAQGLPAEGFSIQIGSSNRVQCNKLWRSRKAPGMENCNEEVFACYGWSAGIVGHGSFRVRC